MIDKLLISVGYLFVAYGLFGLIGTWLAPVNGYSIGRHPQTRAR